MENNQLNEILCIVYTLRCVNVWNISALFYQICIKKPTTTTTNIKFLFILLVAVIFVCLTNILDVNCFGSTIIITNQCTKTILIPRKRKHRKSIPNINCKQYKCLIKSWMTKITNWLYNYGNNKESATLLHSLFLLLLFLIHQRKQWKEEREKKKNKNKMRIQFNWLN